MSWTDDPPLDWKLKLRYGKLSTPFSHFATVSDGKFGERFEEYGCSAGPAVMALRVWALDMDEALSVSGAFGKSIGFDTTGRVEIFDVPPEEPPRDRPYVYAWSFAPYDHK